MPTNSYQPPHPVRAIASLGLLFVVGAWSFAAGTGYIGLVIGVVTLITVVVFAIPLELLRLWRNHAPGTAPVRRSFQDWLKSDFQIWNDQLKRRDAMINVLLPLAAVGLGAVAFAIVFQILVATGK